MNKIFPALLVSCLIFQSCAESGNAKEPASTDSLAENKTLTLTQKTVTDTALYKNLLNHISNGNTTNR